MVELKNCFTVPALALRLGVATRTVRRWIARGVVEAPPRLPVSGRRAWPAAAAARIERWHRDRQRRRSTRRKL